MEVLILGRANVGKSSLFNRLLGRKQALAFNEAGITRDVLRAKAEGHGPDSSFYIMDSGGVPEGSKKDELALKIQEKIDQAVRKADLFVLVVDGRQGPMPGDLKALKLARKSGKPFLLFVNKVDQLDKAVTLAIPFFELGVEELVSGSCEKKFGIEDLRGWILSQKDKLSSSLSLASSKPAPKKSLLERIMSEEAREEEELSEEPFESPLHLFVMGKTNSGKSLLCNQILQDDRMIVSSVSGTTLDTVTEIFAHNKKTYSISDNPGAGRGKRPAREKLSFAKSRTELKKADIVLLIWDVTAGIGRREARLVQTCFEKQKPVLLVGNKTDLLGKGSQEAKQKIKDHLKKTFHFCSDLPFIFVSAKTGQNKNRLFKKIEVLRRKIYFRVPTAQLNRFFYTGS